MKKHILISLISIILLSGCTSNQENDIGKSSRSSYDTIKYDYDDGYEWAEDNDIDNFDDCQGEFGTSDAEDGCNDFVKDNYTGNRSFSGYQCTEDCSGHQAGYEWAEDNDISGADNCYGNSQSFIEGCYTYVEENY